MMTKISADAVRMAYRLFLDREPESSEAVQEKVESIKNYQDLRNGFLASAEFQTLYPSISTAIQSNYWTAPAPIEVDVPPATLNHLLARLRNQWRELGEKEPYWSVLTHEDYLAKNLDVDKISQFYETGSHSARLIELFEQRTDTRANRGTCLELGCGVGRVTLHLAKRFKRVIASDISAGNLALCKRQMEQTGTSNVETVLLDSPVALASLGKFDFFFSIIVLQHNPPPIQKLFLESALRQIKPGGACLFQTVGSLPNYTFSAEQFLKNDQQAMDLHCLPKPVVMRLIHDCGLTVRDVELDPWVGCFGSYTYFATRDR
jgi:2-polyprenyl-3-methyl-5-hydroxy-6-metoxy-1,4-benzoquinol methylase